MEAPVEPIVEYRVWDLTTRWFHWINVLCVLVLFGIGTVILFASDLGVSNDGKVMLKTVHVIVGYLFVINLLWRLVWGFIGGPYSRWSGILPFGKRYTSELVSYLKGVRTGRQQSYLGHNPLGRIAVTVIMIALVVQGATGLVLAGTDVYMPPFGRHFAEWAAAPDMDATQVKPYAPETVNEQSYDEVRAFRRPFIKTHEANYFLLLFLVTLHIAAVIITDVREGGASISAMFTGRKYLRGKARDSEAEPE